MMKNKRLFAILTLVCFMFTFMPVAAIASTEEPTVVSDADELVAALESTTISAITFANDIKIDPANMSNAYGTTGINIKNGQAIDGAGYTLDIKGAGGTWDSGINTTGGLIKNLTVTGSFRGIFINHNSDYSEPVILEKVIIDGTTYTISCDQGLNQTLKATDSTFKGWTSYAATLGSAEFVDCYFGEGSGYAYMRPYAPTSFVDCEFEAGFEMDPRAAVTFTSCTLDGVAITDENLATLVTSNIANAKVSIAKVGDNYYTSLQDAIDEAGANSTVKLLNDVTVTATMTVDAGKDVEINLNGNDISYAVSNSGASAIINNKGTLDIVGEGTISFVAANPDLNEIPAYATNTITNTGTLTIGEGVTVTNGSDGGASYAVDNHGTFILDGGTLIGNRCALRVAKYNQDNVEFIMNSGTVTAKTPAWIQLPGSNAADAPKITVTINDGTFLSTTATSDDNDVLYTYSFGNSHANTSITINGGEFLGGTVSIGSGYKVDAPTLKINGGTFEYDVLQWLANDSSTVLFAANN